MLRFLRKKLKNRYTLLQRRKRDPGVKQHGYSGKIFIGPKPFYANSKGLLEL